MSFPLLVGTIAAGLIVALCLVWDQIGYRRAKAELERPGSIWAPKR